MPASLQTHQQSRTVNLRVAKAQDRYNGLLIVDKPGRVENSHINNPEKSSQDSALNEQDFPTSHDVVQQVRRWSKQRRIGHTGTLDPLASGVLVLCLGPSTRLVEYYQGHPKTYYAEVVLGCATDTYDAFGDSIEEIAPPQLTPPEIDAVLDQFRGTIQQTPPIYSALKQDGESLHHKARRGEAVQVKTRTVTFHSLDLLEFHAPDRIVLRTKCSAGTYIRSLANDLGRALGTVAHLDILRREEAGPFSLKDAATLPQIEQAAADNVLAQLIRPPGDRLDLPEIHLTQELATRFGYGQRVVLELSDSWMQNDSFLAALDALEAAKEEAIEEEAIETETVLEPIVAKGTAENGDFAGVLHCLGYAKSSEEGLPVATVWKAEKWFA